MKLEKKTHYHQYTIKGTPGLWPPLKHHIVITAQTVKELEAKLKTPQVQKLIQEVKNG
jgi:hypothetical protein